MSDFYKLADLKIDELNRLTIKRFQTAQQQIRVKKYDEYAIYQAIVALFKQLDEDTRHILYLLFFSQFEEFSGEEPDAGFEDLFLEKILTTPDSITHYAYDTEVLRKRDRLIEALNATGSNKQAELTRAMRFWSQMVQQYVDNVAYVAAVEAFKEAEVKYVKWFTQNDDKVCVECHERKGKIYPVDKLPERPHWRCRCYIVPLSGNNSKS